MTLDSAGWSNTLGNVRVTPREVARPDDARALSALVRAAESRGGRVHAVGSGLSFTEILRADDVFVSTRGLHRRCEVDVSTLRDGVDPRALVEAEAGVILGDLARALFVEGRSFENLPACLDQTVAGAAATATHGSGLGLGSLADAVRAMELVVQGGEMLRLEGADGPSDPLRWCAMRPDVRLVQDDALFDAARVHLGVFGVVTRLCLRVTEATWLRERRERATWSTLRGTLAALARAHRHVEVWIDPHGDDPRCLVTTRDPHFPARSTAPWHRALHEEIVTLPCAGRAIVALGNRVDGVFRAAREASFAWLADRERVGPLHEVLDLGKPNRVLVSSGEFAVGLDDAAAAAEAVLGVYDRLRARGLHGPSLPFSLRFVAPSRALLSPAFGRETVTLEVPNFAGTAIGHDAIHEVDAALARYHARPHWSQLHRARTAAELGRLYPGFDAWTRARAHFAASGAFDTPLTDRLGLSFRAPSTSRATHTLSPALADSLASRKALRVRDGGAVPAKRDVLRVVVDADAPRVARALEAVLSEPGRMFGLVGVRRAAANEARPFAVGERFQGSFRLAALATRGAERLGVRSPRLDAALSSAWVTSLLDRVEAAAFSDFAELVEVTRDPAPGAPFRFVYRYLEGTPIAGRSVYMVSARDDGAALVTHEFDYQELNAMAAVTFQLVGLREHGRAVEAQVRAAAEQLGAATRVVRPGDE